jgi:hypothetical protein
MKRDKRGLLKSSKKVINDDDEKIYVLFIYDSLSKYSSLHLSSSPEGCHLLKTGKSSKLQEARSGMWMT